MGVSEERRFCQACNASVTHEVSATGARCLKCGRANDAKRDPDRARKIFNVVGASAGAIMVVVAIGVLTGRSDSEREAYEARRAHNDALHDDSSVSAEPIDAKLPNADIPAGVGIEHDPWGDQPRAATDQPFPAHIEPENFIWRTKWEIAKTVGAGDLRPDGRVFYKFDGEDRFIALRFDGDRCVGIEVLAFGKSPGRTWMLTWLGVADGANINGRATVIRETLLGSGIAIYDRAFIAEFNARTDAALRERGL